ncbi:MAG TPA: hypothetical protein VJ717_10585 [Gemmatimonadaceae bacterium]|nr:hypothetical protein [Gemmatimonadaceae bacterium]
MSIRIASSDALVFETGTVLKDALRATLLGAHAADKRAAKITKQEARENVITEADR